MTLGSRRCEFSSMPTSVSARYMLCMCRGAHRRPGLSGRLDEFAYVGPDSAAQSKGRGGDRRRELCGPGDDPVRDGVAHRARDPANKAFRLDLTPGVTSGATGSPITDVTIQYSTDGGKTWHDATITRGTGGVWHAVVHDPASGFVSLRIGVYDKAGSSLQETIYRAYGVN